MQYVTNLKETASASIESLRTLVFVDYESWYWGMFYQYGAVPEVRSWFSDLKDKGRIDEVYFFGDFTQGKMKEERQKLRSITYNIIDCTKGNNEKEYTDFIMLSNIYEKLIRDKNAQQFVLFTGDGHFQSVVAFLRNFNEKVVGIYAVKGTLNAQLADAVDWYVEVIPPACVSEEAEVKPVAADNNTDAVKNFAAAANNTAVVEKGVSSGSKVEVIKKPVVAKNKEDVIKKPAVPNSKEDAIEKMILESLNHVRKGSGSIPSFMKTVGAVCKKNNGLGENAVIAVLSDMIAKGKIRQSIVTGSGGYRFKGLEIVQ